MFFSDTRLICRGMLIVIAFGLLFRVFLGFMLEYNNDVTAWTQTLANIEAGAGLYDMAGYYYPPVWGYILGVFSEFIGFFGVDSWADIFPELLFVEDFEDATLSTPAFNIALMILLTVSDFLVACGVYWIVDHFTGDMVKAKIGFTLFFIGMHVMFVCGCFGQFDSFSALMAVICVCLLLRGNDFLAGMMFALAVLLKLFPAMFFFIFIAYIFVKGGDRWKRKCGMAIAGGLIMAAVIMLPSILNGTVMDSMTFLTARAEGSGSGPADLLKYSSLIIYPIILILEILVARWFVKRHDEDVDSSFVWFVFLSAVVIFLYPSTPQYVLLLTPFVIISALVHDNRLIKPYLLLMAGSTLFMFPSLPMELGTVTFYNGLMDYDTWRSLYDFFYTGMFCPQNVIALVAAIMQYSAILWMGYLALESKGIDLRKKLQKVIRPSPEQE